jgi:hypothetical protein
MTSSTLSHAFTEALPVASLLLFITVHVFNLSVHFGQTFVVKKNSVTFTLQAKYRLISHRWSEKLVPAFEDTGGVAW